VRVQAPCYDGSVQRGIGRGARRRPRILAVTDFFPWPPRNGGTLRTSISVEALTDAGDVDLFSLLDLREPEPVVPAAVSLRRVGTTAYPHVAASRRWRTGWLMARGRHHVPMEVAMRRRDTGPRQALTAWLNETGDIKNIARRPYDVVWFARATIYEWLGRPDLGPTVVDLHDLESDKERRRAELMTAAGSDAVSRVRLALARSQARLNARRWAAFEQSVATDVDRALLASAGDAQLAGLPHTSVLPNTFRRPASPAGKPEPASPPTFLFQGTFDYGPNVDGATWLVTEVGPRIRSVMPGAAIRLVGRTTPAVRHLDNPPDVVVTGEVPDMAAELARADVAVVPVRYAGGTRLKILESFANRVPVVSTPVGAEGLEAGDGVHLLVAESADDFAHACARLVDDLALRRRLVDNAESRFLERYESRVARDRIVSLVQELTARPS